jgi:SAM-dependent methyltransferase
MSDNIIKQVGDYYSEKIIKNGATPQGVDWNSIESQQLRFDILSKVILTDGHFSILDFGCGFGSMYDYYRTKKLELNYTGYDISEEMISEAKKRNGNDERTKWLTSLNDNEKYDYVVASGIFNVKLNNENDVWLKYIIETINKLNQFSISGFSFNVLTKYSDKEFVKDYLYYADPLFLFDYCKTNYSKNVALLHDYNLYEFTIIVRK